ncbi:MAG TPA: amidohydrolase family protein, partial [Longimicrobium sp.]|nr:amidohydrolase family protein [Longimicrobium sp.]
AEASDAGIRSIEHNYGLAMGCSSREAELRDSLRVALAPEPAWPVYSPVQTRIFAAAAASRDEAKCRALFERLASNGTHWTPTLTVLRGFAFMGDSAELARLPMEFARKGMYWQAVRPVTPEQRARREEAFVSRLAVWGEMHRAGVPILAGTDLANPNIIAGWSLHDEMALLVRAGLSPLDALRAATLTPARFLGAADSMGTVKAGRVADLVVLDANPLDDVRNTQRIHVVVARGRLIGPAEREALLAEARSIAAKPMAFPTGGYAPEGEHRH